MDTGSTASNWYYRRPGAPPGQQTGPLTWEHLYASAKSGLLRPDDLVWHPALARWTPAAQIPQLFNVAAGPSAAVRPPAPARPPATMPVAPPLPRPLPSGYTHPAPARPRPSWLWPVLIPVIALLLVGAGLGAYFGLTHGDNTAPGDGVTVASDTGTTLDPGTGGDDTTAGGGETVLMGVADCKPPDRAKLIATSAWGEVPANQIVVVLADGRSREDAASLAQALGGTVVGELEFINAYQIETAGSTEADLTAAIDSATATPGVELATADLQTFDDTEIWGVRQSPLNDPAYGAGRGKGLELIGAPKAWTYVRGCGLPLWDVKVGIVDSGLYKGTGEFGGDVNVTFPDPEAGELSSPNGDTYNGKTVDEPTGSHGTMVANQIGADPGNGGVTGIASPVLGSRLTMSVINQKAGKYGTKPIANPDPNDPTTAEWSNGKSYSFGSLVAITRQIESGAKIVNCSWGNKKEEEDGESAEIYRRFFEKMGRQHPDVLFVCSAGNDGAARDGSKRFPSGLNLPNMITVGNVMNDGTKASSSNMMNTTPGQEYEVTMAAPGHQVVQGVDPAGNPITDDTDIGNGAKYEGGTSAAAPQVAAAAAILRSLDPDLTAGEVKDILSKTARPGPAELGGKILAVDQAVLQVINDLRKRRGLEEVTGEDLEKGGVIDAVAISQETEGDWTVKAIIEMLPSVEGTEVTITATSGCEIEGETSQTITLPGELTWPNVHVPEDTAQVTITRSDNGAASIITFDQIDLNGLWEGTLTYTQFSGSTAETMAGLVNVPIPATLEVTAAGDGTGTAVISISWEGPAGATTESHPLFFTTSGGVISFTPQDAAVIMPLTGSASRQDGSVVITGTLTFQSGELSGAGVWTVTKKE